MHNTDLIEYHHTHWLKYQACVPLILSLDPGFVLCLLNFSQCNLQFDVNIYVIYLISKKCPFIAQLGFGQDIILDLMIESFSANYFDKAISGYIEPP